MPTTLELAGALVPESVEFKSLLPLIRDETTTHYESIYGCYKEDLQRAIISEDYKLILYPKIDVMRLYDLEADAKEVVDLASDPKYAKTLQRLLGEFNKLSIELSDPLELVQ